MKVTAWSQVGNRRGAGSGRKQRMPTMAIQRTTVSAVNEPRRRKS
jgi:hypothetical protein